MIERTSPDRLLDQATPNKPPSPFFYHSTSPHSLRYISLPHLSKVVRCLLDSLVQRVLAQRKPHALKRWVVVEVRADVLEPKEIHIGVCAGEDGVRYGHAGLSSEGQAADLVGDLEGQYERSGDAKDDGPTALARGRRLERRVGGREAM